MIGLLVLHAAALLAAGILVLRAKSDAPSMDGGKAKTLLDLAPKDSVGWVSIRGPIMASESGKPWERGSEQWARRIEQLAETKGVKAIVLDINSPGGSVGAVQEIYTRILRVKKEKNIPFIALFGDVAASGGYYLAAACDKIVAHPGTLTGSIGVIFSVSNMEGLFAKVGYKMTVEEVKPLADGRIYSGNQALANKLVDQLGDSKDALMLAAKMGGIKDEKPRVRRDGEKFSDLFEMLESRARLVLGVGPVSIPLPSALSTHGMMYLWPGW